MANMNKKQEFYMSVKAILDKVQAQKDADELRALLSDVNIDIDSQEFEDKVRSIVMKMSKETISIIGEGFNAALKSLGKETIDLTSLMQMPNDDMWKHMGEVAGKYYAEGIKNAVEEALKGIDLGSLIGGTISPELEKLKADKAELERKISIVEGRISNKTRINKIKDFNAATTTPKDMGADIEAIAQAMQDSIDKIYSLTENIPDRNDGESNKDYYKRVRPFTDDVVTAKELLNEVHRMNMTVNVNKGALASEHPQLLAEWREATDLAGNVHILVDDAWGVVEGAFDQSVKNLKDLKAELDGVNNKIAELMKTLYGETASESIPKEKKKRGRPKKETSTSEDDSTPNPEDSKPSKTSDDGVQTDNSGKGGTSVTIDEKSLKKVLQDIVYKVKIDGDKDEAENSLLSEIVAKLNDLATDVNINNVKDALISAIKKPEVDKRKGAIRNALLRASELSNELNHENLEQKGNPRIELSIGISPDGSIVTAKGVPGEIPFKTQVARELKGLGRNNFLVEGHSHPLRLSPSSGHLTASDGFSDYDVLTSMSRDRKLYNATAMFAGNIVRLIDLTNVTAEQAEQFRTALAQEETKMVSKHKKHFTVDSSGGVKTTGYDPKGADELYENAINAALKATGIDSPFVNAKFDLTNANDLELLTNRLYEISEAASQSVSNVDKLSTILETIGVNTKDENVQNILKAYQVGGYSIEEVLRQIERTGTAGLKVKPFEILEEMGKVEFYDTPKGEASSVTSIDESSIRNVLKEITYKVKLVDGEFGIDYEQLTRAIVTALHGDFLDEYTKVSFEQMFEEETQKDGSIKYRNKFNNQKYGYNAARAEYDTYFKDYYVESNWDRKGYDGFFGPLPELITELKSAQIGGEKSTLDTNNIPTDFVNAISNLATGQNVSDAADKVVAAINGLHDNAEDNQEPKDNSANASDTPEVVSGSNEPSEEAKTVATIDEEKLVSVLQNVTFNVKVVEDVDSNNQDTGISTEGVDTGKSEPEERSTVVIDEKSLEDVLNRVFANIINPPTQQNDGEGAEAESEQAPWAREETLNNVNGVLDNIQNNTSKLDKLSINVKPSNKESSILTVVNKIQKAVDAINGKITKGTSGRQKPDMDKDVRAILMKDLEDRFAELGDLEGRNAGGGSIESKERIASIKEYIEGLKQSLKLTEEELALLQRKQKEAYDNRIDNTKTSETNKAKFKAEHELADLYGRLGKAEADLKYTQPGSVGELNINNRIEDIKAQIEELKASKADVLEITDELDAEMAKIQKQYYDDRTQNNVEFGVSQLVSEYEKLGKLQAQAVADPTDPTKSEAVKQQGRLIAQELKRLQLVRETYGEERKILDTKREEAKATEASRQQAKAAKQDLKTRIKQSKDEARLSKAGAAWRKGDDTLMSLWKIDDENIDVNELKAVSDLSNALNTLNDTRKKIQAKGGEVSKEDAEELRANTAAVDMYTQKLRELISNYEYFSDENSIDLKAKLNPGADVKAQLQAAVMQLTNGQAKFGEYDAAMKQLTYTTRNANNEVTTFTAGIRGTDNALRAVQGTTKKMPSLLDDIVRKTKEIFTYFSGSSVIYKAFNEIRRGIQYVRDIDKALTELKKVTNETAETYEKFLDTASKTADRVGSTVQNVVSSTADWARLGYSLEEAASLAESTSVLLNVSEFESIDQATSALTSTMQAFGYTADNAMNVVDVMNEVGNNFAVSSDGIATALQDSASSLMAANNSYEEAVALVAAANRVVQDPNSVGSALRTISLRLRGTSVNELEESGEDTTGVIESKSKLRSKVKSLSGVDILTDTGAYKSTYEILLEISKVWDDISDVDQAALLEILAGKNRSNTAAAILSNTKDLEEAFASAQSAEGSALAENEKYLDSIQGKIDQFTNSYQTLWSHLLDSDAIKFFVEQGTEIIKSLDTVQGKLLALVKVAAILMAYKKFNPLQWLTTTKAAIEAQGIGNYMKQLVGQLFGVSAATKVVTADTIANTIASHTNDAAKQKQLLTSMGLTNATGVLSHAQKEEAKTAIMTAVANGKMDAQFGANMLAAMGYSASLGMVDGKLKIVDATTKSFMATNPVGWILAIVSAVTTLVFVVKQFIPTAEELAEKANEVMSAYKDATSELKSHHDTIQEIRDDYEELAKGVDNLGNNISLSTEEYERYNEITNQIAEMFPQMVSGYTDEGNAIIALKGNVEELTAAYEEAASAARRELIDGGDAIFKTVKKSKSNNSSRKEAIAKLQSLNDEESLRDLAIYFNNNIDKYGGKNGAVIEIEKILKDAGIEVKFNNLRADKFFTDDDVSYYLQDEIQSKLKSAVASAQKEIRAENSTSSSKAYSLLDAMLEENLTFTSLPDETQKSIKMISHQFDTEFYQQFKDKDEMFEYILKNLVLPMQSLGTITEFEAAFNLQTQFNNSEVSADKYQAEVQKFLDTLKELGFEEDIIKSVTLLFNIEDISAKVNSAKSILQDQYDSKADALTKEDLDIIDKYKSEWNITDETQLTWDELQQKISEAKNELNTMSATDMLDSIGNLQSAFKDLDGALEEFGENGVVAADTLAGLQEKFGNLDGFDNFISVLGDSSSSSEEVKKAISDMAAAYLVAKDILGEVTEENYDFVISQLKAFGVANPEEYLEGIRNVQEAMAEEYGVDLSNYSTVAQMKQAINAELYTSIIGIEANTIEELATQYGYDLSNFTSLELAKTYVATQEAKKRAALERDNAIEDAKQDASGKKNATTVGKNEIEGWLGGDKLKGKTYNEVKSAYDSGEYDSKGWKSEVATWLKNVEAAEKTAVDNASNSANETYNNAVENYNDSYDKLTALEEYISQYQPTLNINANGLDGDFDDEASDQFQEDMEYWENRISANQAKYEQVQNEIDLLEAKGQRAGEGYYKEQIALEEERKSLLEQQRAEAYEYLGSVKEGSEEWWNAADTINGIESELDDVIANVHDLNEAIGQIHWDTLEEVHNRYADLTSDLQAIRDILSYEDMFDEEGNWTEAGVATLATHIQERAINQQALDKTNTELSKFDRDYIGNEQYYTDLGLGIDSEQDYYDKLRELTEQQHDYTKAVLDSNESVAEMYEQQIDAIEEYTSDLVDHYNDYIDSVKEALDAERDLYEFKKDVQKQTKDIAALERRIASLSGSSAAADFAERRKLEAQLQEAKEGLDDTYYSHAKDAQSQALDAEAQAYEETMNRYIDGLRESLEQATKDMTTFVNTIAGNVAANADVVADEYEKTGLALDSTLTQPWVDAAAKMTEFGTSLDAMNKWTEKDGTFDIFQTKATEQLKLPWTTGQSAITDFNESVKSAMKTMYENIESNVQNSVEQLKNLKLEMDKIKTSDVTIDNTGDGNDTPDTTGDKVDSKGGAIDTDVERLQAILNKFFGANLKIDGSYGAKTTEAVKKMQAKIGDIQDGLYTSDTKKKLQSYLNKQAVSSWFRETGIYIPGSLKTRSSKSGGGGSTNTYATMYAKGTMGTSRDQWAITDESWIGEEITLAAGKNGQLQYLKKGSAVMPADISANLVEWGKINPNMMNMPNVGANVNMISNAVNKPEFNLAFEALVKAERIDENTLPEVKKFVQQEINNLVRQMNYSLKRSGAR